MRLSLSKNYWNFVKMCPGNLFGFVDTPSSEKTPLFVELLLEKNNHYCDENFRHNS